MSIEGVVLHYNMLLFACEEKERSIFRFFLIFSFPQSYSLLTLLKHVSTRVYLGFFLKRLLQLHCWVICLPMQIAMHSTEWKGNIFLPLPAQTKYSMLIIECVPLWKKRQQTLIFHWQWAKLHNQIVSFLLDLNKCFKDRLPKIKSLLMIFDDCSAKAVY